VLKKTLYNLYINYAYRKIISNDFANQPSRQNHNNNDFFNDATLLKKNGILQIDDFKINDALIKELNVILDDKIKSYNFDKNPVVNFSEVNSNDSIAKIILSDAKVNFIIKEYLGKNARLDIISLSVTGDNSQGSIISEKWHYDNVGKRLKLFYYLNDNENISTDYVLKTNNLFHKYYSTEQSRRSDKFIQKFKNEINSFFPQIGKIIIFDTNGFHRGNYKENKQKIFKENKISYRKMLKFEFSDSIKSDLFFGKSNSIGVRGTFFSKNFDFQSCPLIDQKYLCDINNFFYYDRTHKVLYNS
jgi:hypothetical protein